MLFTVLLQPHSSDAFLLLRSAAPTAAAAAAAVSLAAAPREADELSGILLTTRN